MRGCRRRRGGPSLGRRSRGRSEREITLGQIVALSGPLAEITPDIVNASAAWFAAVNDTVGINGRKVRLLTLDDGYLPGNTVKAAHQLVDEDQVFALLNLTGTGNVAAVLPMLEKKGVPLLATAWPVSSAPCTSAH